MIDIKECPICKAHNFTIVGNDKVGYGLVRINLANKQIVANPNPEYIAFNVYICNNCKHIELRAVPTNK